VKDLLALDRAAEKYLAEVEAPCGFVHRTPLEAAACIRCEYERLLSRFPSAEGDRATPARDASPSAPANRGVSTHRIAGKPERRETGV
jgi:hypothetical protein